MCCSLNCFIMSVLLDSTFNLSVFKKASFVAILQECEAFRGGNPSRLEPYEVITGHLIKLLIIILCKFSRVTQGAPNQIICCCLPGNPLQAFSSKLSSAVFGTFFKRHNITKFNKVSQLWCRRKMKQVGHMKGQSVLITTWFKIFFFTKLLDCHSFTQSLSIKMNLANISLFAENSLCPQLRMILIALNYVLLRCCYVKFSAELKISYLATVQQDKGL